MSGFVISSGESLSIQDLLKFKNQGYSVARTGHVGNQYFSNLLLHSLGVPAQLFDRNLLLTDVNYHPSCIIQNGQRSVIAEEEDILVPFAKLAIPTSGENIFVSMDKNPGQVHFDSLSRLFGRKNIFTESELMAKDLALLEKIVDIVCSSYPEFFSRKADFQGKTFLDKSLPKSAGQEVIRFNEASLAKICGQEVSEFQGGIIPKIEATLVIGAIISALLSGQNRVFELSGPAMISYSLNKSFMNNLGKIYAIVRKKIPTLPETLELVVVPTFYFRFGSLASERSDMDCLWTCLKEFSKTAEEKKRVLKLFSKTVGLTTLETNERRKEMGAKFNQALDRLAGSIFSTGIIVDRMDFSDDDFSKCPSLKPAFFTQYDLLSRGEKLYVPEEIQSFSMKEVEGYYRILNIAKGRLS